MERTVSHLVPRRRIFCPGLKLKTSLSKYVCVSSSFRTTVASTSHLFPEFTDNSSSNRRCAANDHWHGPPCWRASSLLFSHWNIKTKASQAWLVEFSLFLKRPSAGIIMSLPSSMADFVPCDSLLQKAYYSARIWFNLCRIGSLSNRPFATNDISHALS